MRSVSHAPGRCPPACTPKLRFARGRATSCETPPVVVRLACRRPAVGAAAVRTNQCDGERVGGREAWLFLECGGNGGRFRWLVVRAASRTADLDLCRSRLPDPAIKD